MTSGARMPIDFEPHPDGTIHVVGKRGTVLTEGALDRVRALGQNLYLSHFATCPNAAQHRK